MNENHNECHEENTNNTTENEIMSENQQISNESESTENTQNISEESNNSSLDVVNKPTEVALKEQNDLELLDSDGILTTVSEENELYDHENKINLNVYNTLHTTAKALQLRDMTHIYSGNGYTVHACSREIGGGKYVIGVRIAFNYKDITEMITIRQSEYMRLYEYVDNYMYNSNSNKRSKSENHKRAEKQFEKFKEIIADYQQNGAILNVVEIVTAIAKYYPRLNKQRCMLDVSKLAHVYGILYETVVNTYTMDRSFIIGDDKAKYFRITTDVFAAIAHKLRMSDLELARYLYDEGLLYVPRYSPGYQTKCHYPCFGKNTDKLKLWCYCVLKPGSFTNDQSYSFDFSTLNKKSNEDEKNP